MQAWILRLHDQLNRHDQGLGAYMKNEFTSHSVTFVFALNHPQDEGTAIFDKMSEKIDNNLIQFHSARYICSDFSIHYKEWLFHSNKPDVEGRYCRGFSIVHELTLSTENLPSSRTQLNLLDLFLILPW